MTVELVTLRFLSGWMVRVPADVVISRWVDRAACAGHPLGPEAWQDVTQRHQIGDDGAAAAGVCWSCPVRRQCLEWAVAVGESGIWAATTEADRRKIRRARNLPEFVTDEGDV